MIFDKMKGFIREKTVFDDPDTNIDSANRDLSLLHPDLRSDIELLLERCHMGGLPLYVFEGRRSFKRQAFLYDKGRKYKGDAIVTNAGDGLSFHNYGLAVDLVFDADTAKPGIQWTWSGEYERLGKIVEDFPHLEWGGKWKRMKEFCHIQMSCGYSISQIKAMYDKEGMPLVWRRISDAYKGVDGKE